MGRHIRWQAIITFTGIAMTLAFLGFLSFSRTTIVVPDVGGTYTEGVAGVPQFINPLLAHYNPVDQDLCALIFDGLTRQDGTGGLEPNLAQSWDISEDGLVYLFRLKTDIRWQDNEPFTADDVIFTIRLMQDPEFPGVPYLRALWQTVTVEKLDEYTIRFILEEPYPAFADFTTIGILPSHLLAQMPARDLLNHPFNLQPVGTGPYQLDEVTAEFVHLSANPLYAGPQPRLAKIALRFYDSRQEVIRAYLDGEVRGISYISPQSLSQVQEIESLNIYTARLSGYDIIYFNLQEPENLPFFQEPQVRQALLHALNRQQIIDEALLGQGLVATGPIHPWSWAYTPEQPTLRYDPAKVNALLEEVGWVDTDGDSIRDREGQPLTFTLLSSDDPDKIRVAELITEQWRSFGVAATVEVIGAGLGERLVQQDYQAALVEIFISGDPDPYPLWHQTQIEGGQNYGGWDNDEASILLETARTLTNQGRRNDFYFEFQRIFAQEVPALILFYPVYSYGISKDVYNVQLSPMNNASDRFRTLPEWYVLTRRVIFKDTQFQQQ